MRVALMVEGQEGPSWDEWLALADACETHGLEALFRSDHYLSQSDPDRVATDAWTLIGALAARTSKLRLGTLVSPVTFRHPAVVAKAAGTADPAARFADEYNTFGVDAAEAARRRKKLDEACERVNRDPSSLRFSLMTPFVLGRDHARRFVQVFPGAGSADEWFDELKRRGLAGSPVDLVDGLREFESAGVERVMLQHVVHDDLDVVTALGEIAAAL